MSDPRPSKPHDAGTDGVKHPSDLSVFALTNSDGNNCRLVIRMAQYFQFVHRLCHTPVLLPNIDPIADRSQCVLGVMAHNQRFVRFGDGGSAVMH